MKLKYVLMATAFLGVVWGIPFLVAADQSMQLYGLTMCADGLSIVRYYGGSLTFTGVLAWLMRDATDVATQKAICLSLAIGCYLGGGVALYNQFAVTMIGLVWLTVALYLGFALVYTYLWFKAK
jgi:hypothetical protein